MPIAKAFGMMKPTSAMSNKSVPAMPFTPPALDIEVASVINPVRRVAGTAQERIFVGDSHRSNNPFSCEQAAMLSAITAR
jgi:hypothetical protein